MFLSPPVLEEAAYHAWISHFEFEDVYRILARVSPEEVHRYAKNAFVRGFARENAGIYSLRAWKLYVSEYRGSSAEESAMLIRAILEEEGFEFAEEFTFDSRFAKLVRTKMYELRKFGDTDYVPKQTADKIHRDSQIIAFLENSRSKSNGKRDVVVISSSPILQAAAAEFRNELDEPPPVWSVASLAYLVSLAPGTSMTLGMLRRCLFAEGEIDSQDRITALALRVIRCSEKYELGYSRRATLSNELRKQVSRSAVEYGLSPEELEDRIFEEPYKDSLAEVLAKAIDELEPSKSEAELTKLRQTIRENQ